jgi:hypothetical protein
VKSKMKGATRSLSVSESVEEFTVRLPAHVARRVRFVAIEYQITPEAYLGRGAIHNLVADLENTSSPVTIDEAGDRDAIDQLNRSPIQPSSGERFDRMADQLEKASAKLEDCAIIHLAPAMRAVFEKAAKHNRCTIGEIILTLACYTLTSIIDESGDPIEADLWRYGNGRFMPEIDESWAGSGFTMPSEGGCAHV